MRPALRPRSRRLDRGVGRRDRPRTRAAAPALARRAGRGRDGGRRGVDGDPRGDARHGRDDRRVGGVARRRRPRRRRPDGDVRIHALPDRGDGGAAARRIPVGHGRRARGHLLAGRRLGHLGHAAGVAARSHRRDVRRTDGGGGTGRTGSRRPARTALLLWRADPDPGPCCPRRAVRADASRTAPGTWRARCSKRSPSASGTTWKRSRTPVRRPTAWWQSGAVFRVRSPCRSCPT